jgi:opacity protein-like surface antigen
MKKILLTLLLSAGISVSAFCVKPGTASISGLFGFAIPTFGDWSDAYETTILVGAAFDYQFDRYFGGGVETGYAWDHDHETADVRVQILHITPYLKVHEQINQIELYGIFGIGYYNVDPDPGDSDGNFGFNMGGGLLFPVDRNMKVGFELRWHHIFDAFGDGTDINNIVPTGRFCYFFD